MNALFWLLNELITLYFWAVILAAVMSNLIAFNVLDTRNRLVWTIADFLARITEPALRPIRSILPYFGGIEHQPDHPGRAAASAPDPARRNPDRPLACRAVLTCRNGWLARGGG